LFNVKHLEFAIAFITAMINLDSPQMKKAKVKYLIKINYSIDF